jgi:hypothetical protein
MYVVFLLVDNISEACSSLRPITVTRLTLYHCDNIGLCESLVYHIVMEFMSKSLSALKQDLKSAVTSSHLGNTYGEGQMGFVVCTVRVIVLF